MDVKIWLKYNAKSIWQFLRELSAYIGFGDSMWAILCICTKFKGNKKQCIWNREQLRLKIQCKRNSFETIADGVFRLYCSQQTESNPEFISLCFYPCTFSFNQCSHSNRFADTTCIDEKCSMKTEPHQWSTTLSLFIKRVSKRYVNKQCFKRKQSENCAAQQMRCLFWIRWIDSKWSSACDQSVSLVKQRKKQHQYRPHFNEISCANIGYSRSQSIIHG